MEHGSVFGNFGVSQRCVGNAWGGLGQRKSKVSCTEYTVCAQKCGRAASKNSRIDSTALHEQRPCQLHGKVTTPFTAFALTFTAPML